MLELQRAEVALPRDPDIAAIREEDTHVESGLARSVAVVMATRSYREGRNLYWDREREEIVEREPVASPAR